jgi:hypothetical protein
MRGNDCWGYCIRRAPSGRTNPRTGDARRLGRGLETRTHLVGEDVKDRTRSTNAGRYRGHCEVTCKRRESRREGISTVGTMTGDPASVEKALSWPRNPGNSRTSHVATTNVQPAETKSWTRAPGVASTAANGRRSLLWRSTRQASPSYKRPGPRTRRVGASRC